MTEKQKINFPIDVQNYGEMAVPLNAIVSDKNIITVLTVPLRKIESPQQFRDVGDEVKPGIWLIFERTENATQYIGYTRDPDRIRKELNTT